jgi:biotin carboxyl carrier protein
MKTYKVIVNGTQYEISLEVIDEKDVKAAPAAAPAAPAAAPVAAPAGGEAVKAPMPGTILDVKVQNGASVKKGDCLVILEAMKMENEILAPCDGTVTVATAKGSMVSSGDLLCTIA